MTILLTGGGTGGHITPLLAVAHELKQLQPDARLIYVGESRGRFRHLTDGHPDLDLTAHIMAGKLRRYHGDSWFTRLTDIRTNLLNLRDILFVLIGFCQAFWLILRTKPQAIFIKGSYVGVPVGLAAALLRVPFLTHDSDTIPGLANRIVGRWARLHATGMPVDFYPYPKSKTRFTGIPVDDNFKPVDNTDQVAMKRAIDVPDDLRIVLITGGSQGSQRINTIMKAVVPELLQKHEDLYIIHQVGQINQEVYGVYHHPRLRVEPFIDKFYMVSAAADVVIARASATTIAGLAIQGKPIILIPSPFLTGGHQLKNAHLMEEQGSAMVFQEKDLLDDPRILMNGLDKLLDDEAARSKLSASVAKLGKPQAAKELAQLILEISK